MSHNRREFLKKLGMGTATALFYPGLPHFSEQNTPNFIFILMDDLGYGDLGCYGHPFNETPHIDQLASDGIRFTRAYAAAPNCSPTRASILTGQYPARLGITQYLPGNRNFKRFKTKKLLQPELPGGIAPGVTTVAEALQARGYSSALFGKWHLGENQHAPDAAGFNTTIHGGPYGNHSSMFAPYELGFDSADEDEYLTDFLTRSALDFVESRQPDPFFLFLPYYSVHNPIGGKPELVEKYVRKSEEVPGYDPEYAAMVEGVDQAVGRLRNKLRELDIHENTQIIFFSDNGGSENSGGSTGPFRKQKGWLYEGGIRVPFIASGYGVPEQDEPNREMVFSTDFLPTLLDYAGQSLPGDYPGDGLSLKPVISDGASVDRNTLYWHYPHYSWSGSPPTSAIRKNNMKLIEFLEDGSIELYDLDEDPGETDDLSETYPEKAETLLHQLTAWRKSVGAKMPEPNPNYKEE